MQENLGKKKYSNKQYQSVGGEAARGGGRDWMECWQEEGREENFSSQQNTEPEKFRIWQTKQISN